MAFKMRGTPFQRNFERRTFRDDYGEQLDNKQAEFENQKAIKQAEWNERKAIKQDEWNKQKESGRIEHAITRGDSTVGETVKDLKKDKRRSQWDKFKSFFGGGKEKREAIQRDIDWTKQQIDKYKS